MCAVRTKRGNAPTSGRWSYLSSVGAGCNGEFCGVGVHIPGSAMRALPEVMSMEGSAMVFS